MTNERALEEFEVAIQDLPKTTVASFTYIARKTKPRSYIIKARINLLSASTVILPKLFISEEVVAETFAINFLHQTPKKIIAAALEGTVVTPQGTFAFLPTMSGGFAANFIPLHPEGLTQNRRLGVLQIHGTDQTDHWQNPILDWCLRAANKPYDGLNELSTDFGMGGIIERSTSLEAVVHGVIAVDLRNQVVADRATIGILAPRGLDRSKISLGYRVLSKNVVVDRATLDSDDLVWHEEDVNSIGSTEISVPLASVVNCFACYADVTYHSGWIVDPTLAQNARRSAYERFDPGLQVLTESLLPTEKRQSRDFESAVTCLMWMLGFNTCHLGGTKTLQDGPDILGMTAQGHVIVVECTIGALKADTKMIKLISRASAVRDRLSKSGHTHLRVLPVMVTALPHSEIAAETDDAKSHGVYVLAGDDLPKAIDRTHVSPHADELFLEAEQSLKAMTDELASEDSQ